MATIDFSRPWTIVQPYTDPVSRCAATELAWHLREITGFEYAISNLTSADRLIVLSHDESEADGFYWRASQTRIELYGNGSKGLLNAVYDFLEAVGCRWMMPGDEGMRIPRGAVLELKRENAFEKPVISGRCLIIAHGLFMRDWDGWIRWAARNKYNSVFFHVLDSVPAIGAIPLGFYRRYRLDAVFLARKFGMKIEFGGHGLSDLVPRRLFALHPGLFRMSGGKRTADFNFCVSNPDVIGILKENARAWFLSFPEADVYHLWPDDIPGGGWCSCPECEGFSSSEQALIATNAAAEVLEAIKPEAELSFLAYHDTEKAPVNAIPRKNVFLEWAPRKRCFAHGLGNACPVNNGPYDDGFRDLSASFIAAGAKPARIFEYYQDAVLFKSVVPPLVGTMGSDMRFYSESGVRSMQILLTGDRKYRTAPLNAWLFPRLAWNPAVSTAALVTDFCASWFGPGHESLAVDYYGNLEKAFALCLDYEPDECAPGDEGEAGSFADDPPSDMGDPVNASQERLEAKAESYSALPELCAAALAALDRENEKDASDAITNERDELELDIIWMEFERARLEVYKAIGSGIKKKELVPYLAEARSYLNAFFEWGKGRLEPGFERNCFAFIHAFFHELRLDEIERRGKNPLGSVFLKYLTMYRLIVRYLKARRPIR